MKHVQTAAVLAALTVAHAARAVTFPTDCESAPQMLDRLYSYFGGVSNFTVAPSGEPVFTGGSMAMTINFQPSIFNIAGAAVGFITLGPPALATPGEADTFSITIKGPASGTLAFFVLVREDDNHDGIINLADGDDEWGSPEIFIPEGVTTTINIPSVDFLDTGAGSGDGLRNFHNATRLGLIIDIHSRTIYPGGILTTPRTVYLDHVGFFEGPQMAPPPNCAGDADGNSVVNFADITSVLTNFNATYTGTGPGDSNHDGVVNFADITSTLSTFNMPC